MFELRELLAAFLLGFGVAMLIASLMLELEERHRELDELQANREWFRRAVEANSAEASDWRDRGADPAPAL